MRSMFGLDELQNATMCEPLSFTKEVPVMRIDKIEGKPFNPKLARPGAYLEMEELQKVAGQKELMKKLSPGGNHVLYDLASDPKQMTAIEDKEVEERMIRLMVQVMKENGAPAEQYERLGVEAYL